MSVLSACQPPPDDSNVTVCERDASFISRRLDSSQLAVEYGDIMVRVDSSSVPTESMFLPVEEHPWKKAWTTLFEEGLMSALEGLEESSGDAGGPARLASSLLYYLRTMEKLYTKITRQTQMPALELLSMYSKVPNWNEAVIRGLSLHPKLPFIAIARSDNKVQVTSMTEADHCVLLADKAQIGITCLEWAPHCDQLLAVSATTGIMLWYVDPTAQSSRFLTTWVRVEKCSHPISSLSWAPQGNLLVSCSPADNSLMVWDVPMGVATPVHRSSGRGVASVAWSPDGARVFAGSCDPMFRVWDTGKWSCEKWTNSLGRVKASCWSPKGDILLFALENDPSLYYISFHGNELAAGSNSAIKCADLASVVLNENDQIVVGGCIENMVWDSTGQRLAITFTDNSPNCDLVAVLRTRTSNLLDIMPGGFIRGQSGEVPLTMAFKPRHSNGALLAIAWSSGRLSFTPLLFTTPNQTVPTQLTATPFTAPPTQSLTRTPLYSTKLSPTLSGY